MHYSRLYAALIGIRELHLKQDILAVRDIRAAWKTCPPLDENEPLNRNQVSRECDLILGSGIR
jgi:hypothetical protein